MFVVFVCLFCRAFQSGKGIQERAGYAFPKLGREMAWGVITLDVVPKVMWVDQPPKGEGAKSGAGKNTSLEGLQPEETESMIWRQRRQGGLKRKKRKRDNFVLDLSQGERMDVREKNWV